MIMIENLIQGLVERHSPDYLFCVVNSGIAGATYVLVGLAFLALDFFPPLRERLRLHKCQPSKHPTVEEVKKIVKHVGFQFVFVYPPFIALVTPLVVTRLTFTKELPTWSESFYSVIVFSIVSEIYFYYVHRLLHWGPLYRKVHKFHHEFTSPCALECVYFHWIESLSQLGVVWCGPLVFKSHISLMWLWTFVTLFNVLLHHSGYELPWVPFDQGIPGFGSLSHFHDYHHKNYNVNFGVLGIMDYLHGTDHAGRPKDYWKYLEVWKSERSKPKLL